MRKFTDLMAVQKQVRDILASHKSLGHPAFLEGQTVLKHQIEIVLNRFSLDSCSMKLISGKCTLH